jgi:NAD-dependent oxidoreductase involved in siderophore biosynthesis
VRALFVTDTEVQFMLVSAEMYDLNVRGTTQRTRYQSNVNFEFPKGTLETADAAAVKKVIDEVLATEETVNAVKTSTVELGQTPEQVEAAMGKPETIVKLGAKMTYVYKTMKIIFQDGKVADVQ